MFSVEFGKIYRIFLISSVSELFGHSSWINFFRVPRFNDDARAGRREPQTAAKKLSHIIAKRWRMDQTRVRMGSDTLSS